MIHFKRGDIKHDQDTWQSENKRQLLSSTAVSWRSLRLVFDTKKSSRNIYWKGNLKWSTHTHTRTHTHDESPRLWEMEGSALLELFQFTVEVINITPSLRSSSLSWILHRRRYPGKRHRWNHKFVLDPYEVAQMSCLNVVCPASPLLITVAAAWR